VFLCGHTHVPRAVRLRDGRLIVNPGAVGVQFNHGSPDARYAIVERRYGKYTRSSASSPTTISPPPAWPKPTAFRSGARR